MCRAAVPVVSRLPGCCELHRDDLFYPGKENRQKNSTLHIYVWSQDAVKPLFKRLAPNKYIKVHRQLSWWRSWWWRKDLTVLFWLKVHVFIPEVTNRYFKKQMQTSVRTNVKVNGAADQWAACETIAAWNESERSRVGGTLWNRTTTLKLLYHKRKTGAGTKKSQ